MNALTLIIKSHRRMYQFQATDCPLGPTTAAHLTLRVAGAALARGLLSCRRRSCAPWAAHIDIARL
jgi:hypothetical protein